MLDVFNIPSSFKGDVQIFNANAAANGVGWSTWNRPRGCSMSYIFGVGGGGGGGNGVVGANSTAAGGGGGGSSGQTIVMVPTMRLPSVLFVSVPAGLNALGGVTRVGILPNTASADMVLLASGGGVGGNASGATAGAAGTAGGVVSIGNCPLAGLGVYNFLAGQAGIIGGTTVSGAALTLPATGLMVTGGTGGGGLPAAAAVGTNGGAITGSGVLLGAIGGIGGSAATTPPTNGSNGSNGAFRELNFNYGGTGGGSSHGSATGAGLVGGRGGSGGYGCGGGGGGGALTGSTQGTGGRGGDGIVIIISW